MNLFYDANISVTQFQPYSPYWQIYKWYTTKFQLIYLLKGVNNQSFKCKQNQENVAT